ncbi:DUF72 domain-containing protein [Candidatus Bathyarchaeota archaeon]|nr:DUF72 domain-containing protein [Candidatus Bathyarchaeota archaeon]
MKVGCCGFAIKGGMRAYFKTFRLVELQSTFYKLPKPETAKRWREKAPEGFEFTMKAFQGLTHPTTSPTWRRAGFKPDPSMASRIGFLKPSEENFLFWEKTRHIAKVLGAKIIVIQCPPTFAYSEGSVSDLRSFFNSIRRDGLLLALELRNPSWSLERTKRLLEELSLILALDPFKMSPMVSKDGILYYRLHGLGPRPYAYRYTEEDMRRLYFDFVRPFLKVDKEIYVLWNNISMAHDAKLFLELYGSISDAQV